MTTKQCGNCEFWDKENAINSSFVNKKLAECRFPVPICVSKTMTYEDIGKDCPIYIPRITKND